MSEKKIVNEITRSKINDVPLRKGTYKGQRHTVSFLSRTVSWFQNGEDGLSNENNVSGETFRDKAILFDQHPNKLYSVNNGVPRRYSDGILINKKVLIILIS